MALVALIVLLVLVLAAAAFVFLRGRGRWATAQQRALATSINLRLSDLPRDGTAPTTAPVPPVVPTAKLVTAVQTLAACVGQPVDTVSGWFGTASFAGQVATVKSPTFANVTVPAEQMFSATTVLDAPSNVQSVGSAVGSPKFATCLGQYQVAAVALPSTAQVQTVPLSAPPGMKAYGFVTTFTFPSQGAEVVGDAFILGGRTVTLLSASTSGTVIPPTSFDQAYRAVVAESGTGHRVDRRDAPG